MGPVAQSPPPASPKASNPLSLHPPRDTVILYIIILPDIPTGCCYFGRAISSSVNPALLRRDNQASSSKKRAGQVSRAPFLRSPRAPLPFLRARRNWPRAGAAAFNSFTTDSCLPSPAPCSNRTASGTPTHWSYFDTLSKYQLIRLKKK